MPAVCNTVKIACVLSASQAEQSWQHDSGNKLVRESERKGKLNAMKSEPSTPHLASYILCLTDRIMIMRTFDSPVDWPTTPLGLAS